jgi:1,2-diacylglycerol 3-alpha-glucosyltransferase
MRILMISDVYFPRINGVSTSIATFRRALESAGHTVVLLAPEYPNQSAELDGSVIRVPSRRVPFDPEDRMMKRSALRRAARELGGTFDLIHIQTPFVAHYEGVRLARELRVPVVESYHTYFEEYLYHYVPLVPRSIMRLLARRFTVSQCSSLDALVVPSRAMLSALEDYGVKCPMRIIPTGMEMERFAGGDGVPFRKQLNIAPDQPTLVHVGRVAHEKNIDFLFRMLTRVKAQIGNVVMIVAGEGPALAHCQSYAKSQGLTDSVRFVGYLDRATSLLDCYKAGDLFVFSSKTETQGLVLLEAMALGVPVVSTAYMGTVDILEARLGSVIAPDDETGFASHVVELLRSPERRAVLSREAREYAATWSARAKAAELTELYAAALSAPRSPGQLSSSLASSSP